MTQTNKLLLRTRSKIFRRIRIVSLLAMILVTTEALPDGPTPPPPPSNNHGNANDDLGGGAPIGGGTTTLIILSLLYGGRKIYKIHKEEKLNESKI
jgi:hypothetical protein